MSSNLSKLFERALLQVLHPRLLPAIHHLQGGFRPGFSTAHSSFILSEAIFENKIHKLFSFLAFLDVCKAFDMVWHAGLFYKLFHYGVRGNSWFVLFYWHIVACLHPSYGMGVSQGPSLYLKVLDRVRSYPLCSMQSSPVIFWLNWSLVVMVFIFTLRAVPHHHSRHGQTF